MKQILLLLAGCIPTLAIFSQQDSILKKFRYRIDHFRAISFNGGGGSQYHQSTPGAGPASNNSSFAGMAVTYYALKSTDRVLLTSSVTIASSFNHNNNKQSADTSKNTSFTLAPVISILNKWFAGNQFIELGVDMNSSYYYYKNTGINYPGNNNSGDYSLRLNTGIGRGRLENVTDMQNALWLNKALAAENIMGRELTAEELNELGRAITKANNTRVLDQRKRTQFVLATVDAYLQQKGVLRKTDINYFSNLNDILFFTFNTPRLSGTEKFIRLSPAIVGSGSNKSGSNTSYAKYEDRLTTRSLVLSTGFNKYIAQSLIHQNNYGASVQAGYSERNIMTRFYNTGGSIDELKDKYTGKQVSLNAFYTHAIYPNTRTILTGNIQAEYGYQDNEAARYYFGRSSLYATANYFISYRTRLTATLGAEYQKNAYRTFQGATNVPENTRLYANAGIEINL